MKEWKLRILYFVLFSVLIGLSLACPHPKPPLPPTLTPEPTPIATPSPVPTPAPPRISTGAFFVTGRYGDFSQQFSFCDTHHTWAGRTWPDNSDQIPDIQSYLGRLRDDVAAAVARGQHIHYSLGRERQLDPLPQLDMLREFWDHIELLEVADEAPVDQLASDIPWIRSEIAARGLAPKKLCAIFSQTQVMPTLEILSAGKAPIKPAGSIEGDLGLAPMGVVKAPAKFHQPGVQSENIASLPLDVFALEFLFLEQDVERANEYLRRQAPIQFAAVPQDKEILIVGIFYDRNGGVKKRCVVSSTLGTTYELARSDPRVKWVRMFSAGRQGGGVDIDAECPGAIAALAGLAEAVR
jgi:hypothetical protein